MFIAIDQPPRLPGISEWSLAGGHIHAQSLHRLVAKGTLQSRSRGVGAWRIITEWSAGRGNFIATAETEHGAPARRRERSVGKISQ